ncbi:MAG: LD-carboxypeptidase [Bacteroidales bacterium]|nr:LD-carboxypeptidase [Bacteroidales bacterium]MBN2818597.1 LD-carboxypeptidase [Bacteroidales bacterium]
MDNYIKPDLLKPGDEIVIVAPAGRVEKAYIEKARAVFSEWGLKVTYGKFLFEEYNQFAGTDTQRLSDLQSSIDSPNIKAIICARGGYGTMRLLDKLNWKEFRKSPKWIVGFSDITAIHNKLHNLGFQSIHGPMPINFKNLELNDEPLIYLKQALFEGKVNYKIDADELNRLGESDACITGGNLSILCALQGTAFDIDLKNKILFIEEVGEHYYKLDRLLLTLKLAGKLDELSGLVIGGLTEMEDGKRPFGKSLNEIIYDHAAEYQYPVAFGFPAGHVKPNLPIMLGAETKLVSNNSSTTLTFQ